MNAVTTPSDMAGCFECDAEHAAQADVVFGIENDSMAPTVIEGEFVGVDSHRKPRLGDMIALCYRGDQFRLKRRGGELAGRVKLGTDNPEYGAYTLLTADLKILGIVTWVCRVEADGRKAFRQSAPAPALLVFTMPGV